MNVDAIVLVKTIVCLANSRKNRERCIAGKEISNGVFGDWIRPVSNRPDGAISLKEQAYDDNGEPRLLDLIEIPLQTAKPSLYQKENWLIEPGAQWRKKGRADVESLRRLATPFGPLWINGHSSKGGENDCIPIEQTQQLVSSLILAYVEEMVLKVAYFNGAPRVRAVFSLGGTRYSLSVTDPEAFGKYLVNGETECGLRNSYLTISLGEEYQGNTYKLVAAIINQDSAQGL
jgi:hypothetical protein